MKTKPEFFEVKKILKQSIIEIDTIDKKNKTRIHDRNTINNLKRDDIDANHLETQLQYFIDKGFDIVIELKETDSKNKGFVHLKKSKTKLKIQNNVVKTTE